MRDQTNTIIILCLIVTARMSRVPNMHEYMRNNQNHNHLSNMDLVVISCMYSTQYNMKETVLHDVIHNKTRNKQLLGQQSTHSIE